MLTALCAGAVAALLLVAATGRLRNRERQGAPQRRSTGAQPSGDCAALLDALSRRVRTGSSLSAALIDEARRGGPFVAIARSVEDGASLADALESVRPVDADTALAVQALRAAAHLGGPVAATLDAAAAVLRERAAARAERAAHSAQARLSARLLTIVPLAFTAWNAISSRATRHLYVTNMAAGACAATGILLNLAGWRWMRRIVGPP
jgi:tight adherence protein B